MNNYFYFKHYVLGVFLLLLINACNDDITVNLVTENRPPHMLLSGPEYDYSEPLEAPFPTLWAVATDPDGEDDIAAVVLNISNIKLNSLIVRPDDPSKDCRQPLYVDNDTINVTPYLSKDEFQIKDLPLRQGTSGSYYAYLSYDLLTEGLMKKHSSVFGLWVEGCSSGYNSYYSIESFGLYPPAVTTPIDVFVTYAEFTLTGISITVYDQSGESDTIDFPDFTGYFTNSVEQQTLP